MADATENATLRWWRIAVLTVVALAGAAFLLTRWGMGSTIFVHNQRKSIASDVQVTAGDWTAKLQTMAAGGTTEVVVPRGTGRTWRLTSGGNSIERTTAFLQPWPSSTHVVLSDNGIAWGDDENVAELAKGSIESQLDRR